MLTWRGANAAPLAAAISLTLSPGAATAQVGGVVYLVNVTVRPGCKFPNAERPSDHLRIAQGTHNSYSAGSVQSAHLKRLTLNANPYH
jgi:hypothetical protein